jgi:hypothetical protein
MGQTRRVRKGGAGIFSFRRKPISSVPPVSKEEQKLMKNIQQLEEGLPKVEALVKFEGLPLNGVLQMKEELAEKKRRLQELQGVNVGFVQPNPGYNSAGGKRKSRKQRGRDRRRRMTRKYR